MHPGIARQPFQNLRVIKKLLRFLLGSDGTLQLGIFFRGGIERDVQFIRNHLRDAIRRRVGQTHHASDIANDTLRFQFSKGNDLRNAALAILLANIFQNFATTRFAKIDIDIGRRNTIGIEKTFEDQTILKGIDVRYAENVRDNRTGGRAAAGANWNFSLLREMDEIPDDQNVADKAGFLENAQFIVEPLQKLIVDPGAVAVTLLQAFRAKLAKVTFARKSFRRRILRVFRVPEFDLQIAALRDLQSSRNRFRKIFE